MPGWVWFFFVFFFNDTATTEIYTLSLHDALPISRRGWRWRRARARPVQGAPAAPRPRARVRAPALRHVDRKSTRLNSSHSQISYAVFCLKKKKVRFLAELDRDGALDNVRTSSRLT